MTVRVDGYTDPNSLYFADISIYGADNYVEGTDVIITTAVGEAPVDGVVFDDATNVRNYVSFNNFKKCLSIKNSMNYTLHISRKS